LAMSVNFVATLDVLCGAPGGLDLLSSRRTKSIHAYGQRFGQFALAQNLDIIECALDKSFAAQRRRIDGIASFKDSLQIAHVHRDRALGVDIGATDFRKATRKRRLTTLNSRMHTAAASRILTLVAFATGLSPSTTGSTSNSLSLLSSPFRRLEI